MIQQSAGPVNPIDNKFRRPSLYDTSLQANQEQIAGSGEDSRAVMQQARQDLGVPVTEYEWNMISSAAMTSANPQEEMLRYASAIRFSREYGIPISAAIQNLDPLTEYQIGRKFTPDKNAFQAIGDSMRVGQLTVDRMEVAAQIRDKHYAGEDVTDLLGRMQEIDADIEANQDNLPRSFLTNMAKLGAQVLPYTIDVFNSGGKAGIATAASVAAIAKMAGVSLASTGIGAVPGAVVAGGTLAGAWAVGQTVGTVNRSRELQRGIAYYDMINAGVDKDTAYYLSEAEGTIYGVVEALLNQFGGAMLNAVGIDDLVSKTASNVMGKVTANGTLGAVGLGIMKYLFGAGGEGIEETTQSFTTSIREAITTELTGVLPEDSRGPVEKAVNEGVTGFLAGLMLGLPVGGVNTAIDISRAKGINDLAKQVPSRAAFVKATENAKPESMEAADWQEAMVRTWNRYNGDRTPSVIQDEITAANELDAGKGRTPSGVVRRLQDGSLYTQETDKITTDADGAEHHTLKVGDPISGVRYGGIDYSIKGNTLTIEDVLVKSGYENIRKEAILDLTKQYEGYDIVWEAKGENLEALKQQIISENPRGPEAGLQYYDGITDVSQRMKISQTIREYFPRLNASEISLASTIMQLRAEAKGLSVENYIAQYGKDGRMFGSGLLDDVSLKNIKGTTVFDSIEKGVKAIIYAGQKADFSTFTHEAFHVFRREMEQTKQLEEALSEAATNGELAQYIQAHGDIFRGSVFAGRSAQQIAEAVSGFGETWTALQEEISARLWEAYLLGGQTQSAKLKNIFRRIAEWMRKIYDAIRNKVQLNQKIVEVFDSLLDKDTPLARAARKEAATTKETSSQATQSTGEEQLYQQAPPTDSEAFKAWFGDSKVVDDNGDPQIMYHGGSFDITIDPVFSSSEGLYYFAKDPKIAQSYNRYGRSFPLTEVYLSIQNPFDPTNTKHVNAQWVKDWIEFWRDEDGWVDRFTGEEMETYDILQMIEDSRLYDYDSVGTGERWHDFLKTAKNHHDGFYGYDPTDSSVIAVAFSPTQIKSVNNQGTWDAGNPNILFQEDGKPKLNTSYPRWVDPGLNADLDEFAKAYNKWRNEVEKWVDRQGDMLQFGNEEMVHIIHKNVIPDEKPWRSTTFINRNGEWIPSGHSGYNTKLEAVLRNVGSRDYRPDILFQEAVEKIENGSLAVLHNISASRLASIEDIGGMPSPSLAITKPNIPFTQFGEITLIADPSVAIKALEEERIYDRDVWSPTVPRAEWKINQKIIDKFDNKIKSIEKKTGKWHGGSESFYKSDITNGLDSIVSSYKRNIAAQLLFLEENDIAYELKFEKPKPPYTFPLEVVENNLAYFKSTEFSTENSEEVREYLEPSIRKYLEKELGELKDVRQKLIDDMTENYTRFGVLDRVFNFAKKYDSTTLEFNESETRDSIEQTIKEHDVEYEAWLRDNLREAYTDPKIKIGSKKHDYTAENILKWMRSQSERASQDTMTYGPSKAASNAGRTFANREQVRDFEGTLITREEQGVIWEETIKPLTESIQNELPDYNNKYSTWESLDAIYEAIGNYITKYGSTGTVQLMRKELSAKSFTKVPTWLLEQAVLLARRLATLQQDYFEAKPNRVVSLDEFVSAVVPNTITEEQRSILDKHEISVYEYEDNIDRQSIIEELYASQSTQILFQEASDSHAMDLAREADTWEDFKESYIIDIGMDFDAFVPEDDTWYQETFNRAHDIPEGITLGEEPETARVRIQSEQEKDDYFADILADDEKLKKFVSEMGQVLTDISLENASVADEEEAAERDRLIDLRYRIEHEVTPFIMVIALRSTTSKDINPTSLKAVRTMMTGDGIRFYRDLYADTMQDRELKPAVIDERLPSIDDPGYEEIETLSITERIRLADDIEAEDLKQAILSGDELFAGQAEKVITKMDRDIAALNEKISDMEQEIKDRTAKMSQKDRDVSALYDKLSEAREALDKETRELRRKADADPKYQVDMSNTYALQSKVDALHEQIKKVRVSDKVKATAKRQEALANLRRQLREKQKEKDVARKVREYKIKLARRIMVKPSDSVDYEYRQKIYQIQAMLDPKFRRDSVVVEGERMDLEDAANIFEGSTDEEMIEALGERVYNRIMGIKKPLNDWTMAELEGVAQEVANLRKEGRQIWEAKQEQKRIVAENYQIAMIRSLVATGKYQKRTLPGSIEDDRRRKSVKERLRSVLYATWDADRWAQMIDNNKKGDAYELLVRMRRRLQQVEWENIERRVKPVIDLMKSKNVNLKPEGLYKTVEISLSGMETPASVTYSYLMYAYLSQFNDQNRDAVAYGVLVSTEEKKQLNNDNDLVRQLGDRRYNELIMLAEKYLGAENPASPYMQVVEAIRQDLNSQAPRINEIAIREYNQPMRTLENYLPNHRLGATGKELAENIMDDLFNMNAGSMPTGVNRGFMQNRVNISPVHQTEVNMDLFGVWDKSMRQHEHMIAFAEYGRMLDRVFKNKTDGVRMLRGVITGTYGDALMSDIDEYINETINPDSFNRMGDGDRLLRALRGNLGAAYLAWKVSGLVLQGITSPMPFLADMNPAQLLLAYKDFMRHPIESWKFITERSQMMKNRSMNPIIQLILDRAKENTKNRISKLNKQQQEIGAMGLTWVDRVSVAGGWIGAYRKKLSELQKQQGMTEEIRDRMASEYADEVVLRTQPTGDKLELSPLFKMGGEGMKIITQFQTSLNVIWKNLTYDVPAMVRNHETARIVGQITGYVLAGALLGAVAEGHDDDDDTAKEKLLNWIYWSTTQFSQATPLLGNEVDSVLRSLITGDKPEYFSRDLFPAASNILSGIVDITQENYGRAVRNLSEGFGYATGLPVSGTKQAIRAFEESPAAVLGRRE